MQPLYHPPASEITVQGILHALSDPIRVRIFMQLAAAECPQNCTTFCRVGDAALPKSSLSQHFKILREAGLIRSERKGVELRSRTRCGELHDRFGPLVSAIVDAYEAELQGHESGRSAAKPLTRKRKRTRRDASR